MNERKYPLNTRFSNLGYTSLVTIDNFGFQFLLIAIQLVAVAFLILTFIFRKHSIFQGLYRRTNEWILFGVIVDIILAAYLPILISLFLGVVGLDWNYDKLNGTIVFNNLMTIGLTVFYVAFPGILFIFLYANRVSIGRFSQLQFKYILDEIVDKN